MSVFSSDWADENLVAQMSHSNLDTAPVLYPGHTVPDTFFQMCLIMWRSGQLVNESDSNLHALITVNYTEEGTAQRFN